MFQPVFKAMSNGNCVGIPVTSKVVAAVTFTLYPSVFFASTIVFNNRLSSISRAKEDYAPSAKASLLFGYPLLVKADGVTKSTISIFVRSDKGMPVKDQSITVTASVGELSQSQIKTDDKGKAMVTLTSSTPGASKIDVMIGGSVKMTQSLTITFQ